MSTGAEANLTRVAYDKIRAAIVYGALDLGEPLSENALARALGMSKAPIRAAMGDQPVGVVGPHAAGGPADVEVRAFVPDLGIPEDPVTGSLAGGLGIWLPSTGVVGPDFVIRQGTALGRRGMVRVAREDGAVWVGGGTVVAVTGTVALGS